MKKDARFSEIFYDLDDDARVKLRGTLTDDPYATPDYGFLDELVANATSQMCKNDSVTEDYTDDEIEDLVLNSLVEELNSDTDSQRHISFEDARTALDMAQDGER